MDICDGYMTEIHSASTANVTYRALQQWFKWMMSEEEIDRSPMERTTLPFVPDKPVPLLSVDQLRTLLQLCKGWELLPLRDTAESFVLTVHEVRFGLNLPCMATNGTRPDLVSLPGFLILLGERWAVDYLIL